MKLTTLDVLIITFLSQKPKHETREQGPFVELDRSTFKTYSQYVQNSPLFNKRYHKTTVFISIADYYNQASRTTPAQDFAKKCSYWRRMYNQDRLLPFAQNGFGAIRLANNAELFSDTLFNPQQDRRHIAWNLKEEKCYMDGKPQPGNGLQWAWDFFAVVQLITRECGFEWNLLDPRLECLFPKHIVTVSFQADVVSSDSRNYIPNGRDIVCFALQNKIKRVCDCGGLRLVSHSDKIIFKKYPKKTLKLSKYAKKLLWLCVTVFDLDKEVPLEEAFKYVTGRNKPKKKHEVMGDNDNIERERKQKTLENVRNRYWQEIQRVARKNNIKKAPYIHVSKTGVQIRQKSII